LKLLPAKPAERLVKSF